jgi:mono/diheme cytochrome c family protein
LIQGLNLRRLVIVGKALLLGATATALIAAQADTSSAAFDQNVTGFITKNCAGCHNEKLKTAGLALTSYHDTASLLRDRAIWEKAIARVRAGEMPPKGLPRPKPEDIATTTNWIEEQFATADEHPDPGHLTAHRLNRTEYNNTVRDLLGVRFKPAADFPADDSGFGFDNIGDALSVSPVLMEKYLGAAKKIAIAAIPLALTAPKPTRERFSPEHGRNEVRLEFEHSFDLPAEGDYDL